MCFSKKKSVCVRVREITCSEWMTWGWGRRNMYHVWPKASWLWLPSPLFLPRMLTCTLRDSRCVRDPTMVGSTFCRTCEVEGPLYLYSTLLGRGWPCYHVLEGPTDFKGVVLKVWTCGLGGGGSYWQKGTQIRTQFTVPLRIFSVFANFDLSGLVPLSSFQEKLLYISKLP